MTNKQALEKSIKHWQDNVCQLKKWNSQGKIILNSGCKCWYIDNECGEISFDSCCCALCIHLREECDLCPLYKIFERCNTPDSAWRKCYEATSNKTIIKSAENMVATLIKCRKFYGKVKTKEK